MNLVNNEWKIGDSDNIGGNISKVSTEGGQGIFDLHQISSDKWEIFEIGEGWIKIGPGDVAVECKYKGNFEIIFNTFLGKYKIENEFLIFRNPMNPKRISMNLKEP